MPKKLHRRSAVFRKKKVTFTRVLIGLLVVVGCAGVLAGGIIGAFLLKKLPPKWVVVIFAVVLAAAGVKMLFF